MNIKTQKNKKITLLQALIIYAVAVYSPSIRFITTMAITTAHQAGWLAYIVSLVLFIPLLYVLYKVNKKFEGQSIYDILCQVFGKFVANVLSILYIIWMFLLLSLYIRYCGQKLVSTIYVYTDIKLVMFLAVVSVGITLRWGLAVFERMNKMIFALLIFQITIAFAFMLSQFSLKNITPISTLDIPGLFKSTFFTLAVSSYVSFLFIFNDQIEYGKKDKQKFIFTTVFLTIISTLIILGVLGIFGAQLGQKFTFPFFAGVKSVSLFQDSSGIDALFLSIWMLGDFITIGFFAYCTIRLIKYVFKLESQTPVLTAVLGLALFFALFITRDLFQLLKFSKTFVVAINLVIGLAMPFVIFITAKIRKLL